jgi:hypothetical protein
MPLAPLSDAILIVINAALQGKLEELDLSYCPRVTGMLTYADVC